MLRSSLIATAVALLFQSVFFAAAKLHDSTFEPKISNMKAKVQNRRLSDANEPLQNIPSALQELYASSSEAGDMLGWSSAMEGNWMAVGSPGKKWPISEVQVVQTSGGSDIWLSEIQLVGISLKFTPEVQTFHTTAAPHATVGGTFKISYPGKGSTLAIPATAAAVDVEAAIENMLDVGDVSVSRTPFLYCACNDAYTWQITFLELLAPVKQIRIDAQLTGDGSTVPAVTTLQQAARVRGSFRLTLGEDMTRPLSYDVSVAKLQQALEQDLGLEINSISVLAPTPTGGQNWEITFRRLVAEDIANIPMLGSDSSMLLPAAASVWHQTLRDGESPLSGNFQLEWRNETTAPLRYDATAEQVKTALEALTTIEDVSVRRFGPSASRGYDWLVTFHHVLRWSVYGYVTDNPATYEPLQAISLLTGTEPSITVLRTESLELDRTGYERTGSNGENAGAVWTYFSSNQSWHEVDQLHGNDTKANDRFGHSLSIDSNVLLVGAPYSDHEAVVQQQQFTCDAVNGSFSLQYGTRLLADNVAFNATAEQLSTILKAAWEDDYHQLPYVEVDAAQPERGVCVSNSVLLTLYSPTFNTEGMMLLPLHVVDDGLVGATTEITQSKSEIMELSEPYSGGVYVFGRSSNDDPMPAASNTSDSVPWKLKQKLRPSTPTGGDRFGWAVAHRGDLIAVGSPGNMAGKGLVDVFYLNAETGLAEHIAALDAEPWEQESGDNFGSMVAIGRDQIDDSYEVIISAPGKRAGEGAVYIFSFEEFQVARMQELTPSDAMIVDVGVEQLFGCSLAIDEGWLVISACSASELNSDAPNAGAVFIFRRFVSSSPFELHHKLEPSRATAEARFGWRVALDGNVLAVASLQDYSTTWRSCTPVVALTVESNTTELVDSTAFTLSWQQTNDTGAWEWYSTPILYADNTTAEIQAVLEETLGTGPLEITQTPYLESTQTFTWLITFLGESEHTNLLRASTVEVYNRFNGQVQTAWINPPCERITAQVRVFSRSTEDEEFVEDLFAYPFWNQPAEMFGHSLALSDFRLVIGAPNADTRTNRRNAGAAMAYNLDLLHTQMVAQSLVVAEGDTAMISLEWRHEAIDIASRGVEAMVTTFDLNPTTSLQQLLRRVFAIDIYQARHRRFDTLSNVVGVAGTAVSRTWPEDKTSVWSQGVFDYRAVSDYMRLDEQLLLSDTEDSISLELYTTADTIFECPDETVNIGIHQLGLFPSALGRFFTTITIKDDGDGARAFQDATSPLFVDPAANLPAMDLVTYVDKLESAFARSKDALGGVLAVEKRTGIQVLGLPNHQVGAASQAGAVLVMEITNGELKELAQILPPNPTQGARFGAAVAVSQALGRTDMTIAVSELGTASVHIFSSAMSTNWQLETTVQYASMQLPQHQFGASIGLHHDFLAVGVPGQEAVVLYTRQVQSNGTVSWSSGTILRSSAYDYDLIVDEVRPHAQKFGSSIAFGANLLIVGAPFADYVKGGTDDIETYRTEGYTKGMGRGAVFSFFSLCPVWQLAVRAGGDIITGTFQLAIEHKGSAHNITLQMPLSAVKLKQHLEALDIVDVVQITTAEQRTKSEKSYYWDISFVEDTTNPSLSVAWHGFGCDDCEPFNLLLRSDPSQQVSVKQQQARADWQEHQKVQADDRQRGDRFGASVALDNTQLVIGAPFASADSFDNWGFETGTCDGWTKTGDAFDYQPTFGDNSKFRRSDGMSPPTDPQATSSRMRGRYFIGTYEMRPGNVDVDYLLPNPNFTAGSYQGNGPQGTLTSSAFVIQGSEISFLLGGGCDRFRVYVELLVDGMRAKHSTGICDEVMRPHRWNVTALQGRAAQIRIVDASSDSWGHINVDEFVFDWDIYGGHLDVNDSYVGGQLIRGRVETPLSGAAYVFQLTEPEGSKTPCRAMTGSCRWVQEGKLLPSDKRSFGQFGTSVAIEHKRGLVAVGAPGAFMTGLYKELQSDYPFDKLSMTEVPVHELDVATLFNQDAFVIERETGIGLWELHQRLHDIPTPTVLSAERAGAVYLFTKIPALVDPFGTTVRSAAWSTMEQIKLQAPDEFARDHFGRSAALSDRYLFVGAPGHDLFGPALGTMYTFDATSFGVSYSQGEFVLLEGSWSHVVIRLMRDLSVSTERIAISYATSDISATGVDTETFDHCLSLYLDDRDLSCGDYERTAGDLVFAKGASEAVFFIRVMNNPCRQPKPRFVQLTMGLPGSFAFVGDSRMALLRIDDDDLDKPEC